MRVVRCFAFLDLCGFTAFTERHGDAAAVAELSRLRAILRAQAEEGGVRVTKWLGDGAMLSGVDPASVVTCVRATFSALDHATALPLRAGVAHGPTIMFEGDDYIGAPVNLASRLCDAADPGRILLTRETAEAANVLDDIEPVDDGSLPLSLVTGGVVQLRGRMAAAPVEGDDVPPALGRTVDELLRRASDGSSE
jgi:class 3 adenylate cyclase